MVFRTGKIAGERLFLNLFWRAVLLIATCLATALVATRMLEREFVFTIAVGITLAGIQIYSIVSYVMHVNKTLVSFIDTIGQGSATELQYHEKDTGFISLESRLNQLKSEVRNSRFEVQKNRSLLEIVIDTMDAGIICVNQRQEVVFSNRAADSILSDTKINNLKELDKLYPRLAQELNNIKPGSSRIISLSGFKASVRCRHFELDRKKFSLFTIQNIQKEADAQESIAWQKLIRVLTHEIMNSMGPILSLSRSLRNSAGQPEKVSAGLTAIENTGDRLINFISEYRKLTSLPKPAKTLFAVNELFGQIESLFFEECKKSNVNLEVHQEESDLELEADRNQVEQILVNLIKNALESIDSSPGGIIDIRAKKEQEAACITVSDNGPGIPEELAEKIFVPFYTTKKGGTGIGLSLSRQIMTNHNGSLVYSSIPGKKTVFTLCF